MLNLIKMNLYKMFRTKSFYVILGVFVAYILLGAFFNSLPDDNSEPESSTTSYVDQEKPDSEDDGKVVIHIGNGSSEKEDKDEVTNAFDFAFTGFRLGFILALFSIFIALFAVNEFSSGYIKNIAEQVNGRWKIIISKLITVAIYELIFFAVGTAAGVGFYAIFNETTFALSTDLLVFAGMLMLFYFAFASLIVGFVYITRSKVLSIVMSLLLTMEILTLISMMVGALLDYFFDIEVNLGKYFLSTNLGNLNIGMPQDDIVRIAAISVGAIILYIGLGIVSMKKRDIR